MRSFWTKDSLRYHLMLLMCSVVLVSAVLIITGTVTAVRLTTTQAFTANSNTSRLLTDQMDKLFSSVRQRLYGIVSYETEIRQIAADRASNASRLAQQRMRNYLVGEAYSYNYMDVFFLYVPEQDFYVENNADFDTLDEKYLFRADLKARLISGKQELPVLDWTPLKLGNRYYLMCYTLFDGAYYGSLVNAEHLIGTLDRGNQSGCDYLLLAMADGTPMTTSATLLNSGFDYMRDANAGYLTKGYMVVGAGYSNDAFRLLTMTRQSRILAPLWVQFGLCIASILIFLVTIPIYLTRLNKWILRPIEELTGAMEKMKSGEIDTPLASGEDCQELRMLKHTFLDMRGEIKELKLSVYEEQLMKQKTELNYYRLQIHPHFFLNCMNMIHSFVQAGKVDLVQRLVQSLCSFYRFSIRNTSDYVPLATELEHTRNYLDIQQIRFGDQLQVRFIIEAGLEDARVPPLIVVTFVENVVKYALGTSASTIITVEADTENQPKGMFSIRVKDNGPGFSEEEMEDILSGRLSEQDGHRGDHLGIYNIQQRLWLLYGEGASLVMSNVKPHGAMAEVTLPLEKEVTP